MIHKPLGGFQVEATDIEIHAREILHARERLNEVLAHHTGQPLDRIKRDAPSATTSHEVRRTPPNTASWTMCSPACGACGEVK